MAGKAAAWAAAGPLGDPLRLARLLELVAQLPEAQAADYGAEHRSFRVRKKTFAYWLDNHHGDGVVAVCCKSTLPRQREWVRTQPDKYLVPAYLGPSGWVSLRLDQPSVDWREVAELLTAAYRLQAPKKLAALVA